MATQSKESTTLTQNKLPKTQSVTHVEESHKKAKLKRKFSAAVTLGDEGPSDKQKSPLKRKKKTAKFPSMSINEFLELNQEQNGDQMEDDEGDNGIGQQLEGDISPSEANEQANNGEIEGMEQEMDGLKTLVKCFLLQNNPGMDLESLAAKLGCSLGDASSAPNFSSHEEENDVEQED
ncbi:hypothetical protein RJT34_02078 [Clitoria ternatea]|uniref:Uncharacterized protein n=1 Tax=Clitoria ternatea TaxID=43366 RepID=A0AAN9Q3P5_CLITE